MKSVLKLEDLEEWMQLRCVNDKWKPCFYKNDIVTVRHTDIKHDNVSGLILICRGGKWHAMEDFAIDNDGQIVDLERINN
jgi:hypothetical protein